MNRTDDPRDPVTGDPRSGDARDAVTHAGRIDPEAEPATIEKQIDAKRADIGRTLDALEQRFSPGQMVDQTLGVVRDNGGEMAQNLGRQFRDNPMPFVLVGVGVLWAIAAQGRGGRGDVGHYRSRYGYGGDYAGRDFDERYDHDDFDRGGARSQTYGLRDDGSDFTPRYSEGSIPSTTGSFATDGDEDDESMLDKARERFDAMGNRLSDTATDVSDRVAGMSDEAARRYRASMADAARRRGEWGRGMRDGMDSVGRYGRDAGYRARYQARSATDTVTQMVQDQPMVAGALGVAVGAMIGALLPSSDIEDRYIGEHADEAKRLARERAESGMERANEELEGGMQELRGKVEQAAGTMREKAERIAADTRQEAENRLGEADRKASEVTGKG